MKISGKQAKDAGEIGNGEEGSAIASTCKRKTRSSHEAKCKP